MIMVHGIYTLTHLSAQNSASHLYIHVYYEIVFKQDLFFSTWACSEYNGQIPLVYGIL